MSARNSKSEDPREKLAPTDVENLPIGFVFADRRYPLGVKFNVLGTAFENADGLSAPSSQNAFDAFTDAVSWSFPSRKTDISPFAADIFWRGDEVEVFRGFLNGQKQAKKVETRGCQQAPVCCVEANLRAQRPESQVGQDMEEEPRVSNLPGR